MKNFRIIMSLFIAGSLAVMTGCKKDDDGTTDYSPVVNFVGGAGYVAGNVTLQVGESFQVGITASSNASSDAKLVNFKVVSTANNTPMTRLDSTISTKSFGTWTGTYTAQSTPTTENWTFTITDADNYTGTVSFTITTVSAGPISTFSSLALGAQSNSSLGSFLDADGGTVYLSTPAQTNQATVDAVYFNGTGNATIASPTDSEAKSVFTTLPFSTTNNVTSFVDVTSSMSVSQFDAITTDGAILSAVGTPTLTQISGLAVNSIVGFKTQGGKSGLFKVTALTPGNTGSVTITIKVQQ